MNKINVLLIYRTKRI